MDKELADFLGSQSPFDKLDSDDLERLAAQVELEAFANGSVRRWIAITTGDSLRPPHPNG